MEGFRDRAVGALLGLAVGDALGAPFEFQRASAIPHPLPAFALSWMGMPPGTWTDDTHMARNLWCSLIEHEGRLILDDVLRRHLRWLEGHPLDVGNLTRRVLTRWSEGVEDAAREYVERRGPEVSAGNGSVMYCAPLGVARATEPHRLRHEAPALSALTHWDERCRTACLAVTLAISSLVRGQDPESTVEAALCDVRAREGGEELEYLVSEAGRARPIDGPDRGFVLFTAGVALQVVAAGHTVEDGLRLVIGLGGDTDTNAAVAGALLGARHGRSGIPVAWLRAVGGSDQLNDEAEALAEIAARART